MVRVSSACSFDVERVEEMTSRGTDCSSSEFTRGADERTIELEIDSGSELRWI